MRIPQLSIVTILMTSGITACGSANNSPAPEAIKPDAPIVSITAESTIKRLDNFELTAIASDVNEDISSYLWQQTAGPDTVNILNETALNTQVSFPKIAGKYTFQLTVTDSTSLSTSKSIEINVTNAALLDWYDCNLPNIQNKRADSECLDLQAPLDWSAPSAAQIENLVVRYLAPQQPAKGKVWILDGGPGGNAKWAMRTEHQQKFNSQEWDIYIPIHRGVEGSSKLVCENGLNLPTSECFNELMTKYDGELSAFNTENAAFDLIDVIDKVSETTEKDIIYGASYGTFLAQKYLQLQTEFQDEVQIDGVILDSSVPLDFQAIEMAENYELIGNRVLDLCNEIPFCREQLDGDAHVFIVQTYEKLSQGKCFIGGNEANPVTVNFAKTLFDTAVSEYIDTVPGILKMLNRCNTNDQNAFLHVKQIMGEPEELSNSPFLAGDNLLVTANVNSTNMFRPDISKFEYEEKVNQLKFTGLDNQIFYELAEAWPLDANPLNATLPATSVPLLMLNGGLDPQSTDLMAEKILADYLGAQKKLVLFPNFSHGVIMKQNIENSDCFANIVQSFMADPELDVDSQCAANTLPVDVAVETDYVKSVFSAFFGISSPW